jgi:hypothetical protein
MRMVGGDAFRELCKLAVCMVDNGAKARMDKECVHACETWDSLSLHTVVIVHLNLKNIVHYT